MGLAREAIATAAKAAGDELERMRELVEKAEARAQAAEERARAAEERARAAADAELLLADIRDQIVSKVSHPRAA
jgi:phage shock protein A